MNAPLKSGVALCLLLIVSAMPACTSSQRVQRDAERDERARIHMDQAKQYMDKGLTDSALAAFGLALEENPRLTEARVGMGQIYIDKGDYKLAEESLEAATRNDPNSFDAHYYLGLSKQLLGRVKEAIRVYLQALAIDPNYNLAREYLGEGYLQAGDIASARAQLAEIKSRCGTSCREFTVLARAIEDHLAGRSPRAKAW